VNNSRKLQRPVNNPNGNNTLTIQILNSIFQPFVRYNKAKISILFYVM
jgi:hypothetical protein